MNQSEVTRQINQMEAFIKQEAQEKADEIAVKTEKEFMADKLSIETQRSIAIRAEHEKHKKDFITAKKIEKSKLLTESRFKTMRARDAKMVQLKKEVIEKLAAISKSAKYPELVKFLIAQGLMTLLEHDVTIQCRKEDESLVKAQLQPALKLFQDTLNKSTGVVPTCNVTLSTEYLPAGPTKSSVGATCAGGVVLSARGGQIVCRNTLDARLDLAYKDLQPAVRGALFGVRAKIETAAPISKHGVSLPK